MIGELIMRLFHARTTAHVMHLKTKNYAAHKALNEFYDEIVDLADSIAESYQGTYGLIDSYPARYVTSDDPIKFLTELLEWVQANRHKCWDADETHLENMTDEVVALITSTLYKLRFLK